LRWWCSAIKSLSAGNYTGIFFEKIFFIFLVIVGSPDIRRRTENKGLNEVDAEETKHINERCNKGKNRSDFRESEKMKRSGIANLLTPASKQEINNGKEYGEEESIGYI
jgi:hypothetical protein